MLEPILTVLSIVIGTIAYLIRQLIVYLKRVSTDLTDVKNNIALIKAEFKGNHLLLNEKYDYLNGRINRLEGLGKPERSVGRKKG